MSSELCIGVVGATGALGAEIVGVLDNTRWRPKRMVPVASPATSAAFVEYGDHQVAVEDPNIFDVQAVDALILAAPEGASLELGERAVAEGVPVIDASGAFSRDDDVPVVVPWVNPEAMGRLGARAILAVPHPAAHLIASLLMPLARAGIMGHAKATILLPASAYGRAGLEELSRQVVTLFNAGTAPRKVFPHGLAFDVLPQVGSTDDGVTAVEERVIAEVRAMLGFEQALSLTVALAPVFSGVSLDLHLSSSRAMMADVVSRLYAEGGLTQPEEEGARYQPRPRRVEGKPFAHVGRVRVDGTGHHLDAWAALDNLRSTAVAVSTCTATLLREQIQDG